MVNIHIFSFGILLAFSCIVYSKQTPTPCTTADDCPVLHCCVKPQGNSVDREIDAHPQGINIIVGKRSPKGHCMAVKGPGEVCWTKTDVTYDVPHEMTDDCPCHRGLYCIAMGIYLPGGAVGVCSV